MRQTEVPFNGNLVHGAHTGSSLWRFTVARILTNHCFFNWRNWSAKDSEKTLATIHVPLFLHEINPGLQRFSWPFKSQSSQQMYSRILAPAANKRPVVRVEIKHGVGLYWTLLWPTKPASAVKRRLVPNSVPPVEHDECSSFRHRHAGDLAELHSRSQQRPARNGVVLCQYDTFNLI